MACPDCRAPMERLPDVVLIYYARIATLAFWFCGALTNQHNRTCGTTMAVAL